MICEKCFKQIDDDSKFCFYCGTSLTILENYSKGNLITFSHNKKWGFKDKDTREIVVPLKYDFIGNFSDDRAVVMINFKYGFVDKNGKEITRLKYDFAKESKNGYAPVKRDDKWSILDINCSEITPFQYDSVDYFQGDFALVSINNKFSLINKKGEEITKRFYDKIGEFSENLHNVRQDLYQKEEDVEYTCTICNSPVDKDDKYCKNCNADLSEVIYEEEQISKVFNENIAFVKLSKKYGAIDNKGNEIIPLIYDSLENFSDGMLKVKENDKYGLLTSKGEKIISCFYDDIVRLSNGILKLKSVDKLGFFFISDKLTDCKYDEYKILNDDTLAVKEKGKWIAFNNLGEDISSKNENFLNYDKIHKRRKKKKVVFGIFIFLLFFLTLDSFTDNIGIIRELKIFIQGEDEFTWNEIKNSYNILKLQEYLQNYPNGEFKVEAEELIENLSWNGAIKSNTIESYKDYLTKYPNGKFKSDASDNIENILWDKSKKTYTIESFKNYLVTYPNGKNSNKAKDYIEWIKAISEHTIGSMEKYLKKFSNGEFAKTATNYIDDWIWYEAKRNNTLEAYQNYLYKYPNGNHSVDAQNDFTLHYLVSNPYGNNIEKAIQNIEKKNIKYYPIEISFQNSNTLQWGTTFLISELTSIKFRLKFISTNISNSIFSVKIKGPGVEPASYYDASYYQYTIILGTSHIYSGINDIVLSTSWEDPDLWKVGEYWLTFFIDDVQICDKFLNINK